MTTFSNPEKGIYCYKVMPFGLKNAGATYQRAMQKVFDDMLHKHVKCYVDDFVVKIKRRHDHLKDQRTVFDRLRKYQLKMNPLKCAFSYDIVYVPQRAVKRQALANFLADHPVPSDWELSEDLLDDEVLFTETSGSWVMFFDGTTRKRGVGAGIILISPEKHILSYSFALAELCSNNVAEYQALIIGLQMALEIGVACIEISSDSKLIINQLLCQYEVKHDDLKPYFTYAHQLMEKFESVVLEHVPRIENKKADALVNLATTLTDLDNVPFNISLWRR
ncbi:uncharacterized protein LOC120073031 [Benincasa hispida]|uniref:uncharacterized protein LOC120073031 n=1 Tax=Benincasa hispida TaxID=102211 RepID=UPI0018FFC85E|nr:uncharacterized protein LOC120073031 [Benincasa hispida]